MITSLIVAGLVSRVRKQAEEALSSVTYRAIEAEEQQRERVAKASSRSGKQTPILDLEVQFAGQTAKYKQVPFELVKQGNQTRISGTLPATLSDFKIDPPSLLTMPVKNEIPVRVEMTWHSQ